MTTLLLVLSAAQAGWLPDFAYDCGVGTNNPLSGTNGWVTGYTADGWQEDGACHSVTNQATGSWGQDAPINNYLLQPGLSYTDFRLQTEVINTEGDGFGVVFRHSDASNFYVVHTTDDDYPGPGAGGMLQGASGIRLYSVAAGSATELGYDPSIVATNGVAYTLTVTAIGDQIEVFWDGAPVFQLSDGDHGSGSVGMYAYTAPGADFQLFTVDRYDGDDDGFAPEDGDCDDANALVHPGADELCGNGLDDDCSGLEDDNAVDPTTWYLDADLDGFGFAGVSLEECDPPVGFVADATDCDDTNPAVYPGAPEIPGNGVDEDCDGVADPGGTGPGTGAGTGSAGGTGTGTGSGTGGGTGAGTAGGTGGLGDSGLAPAGGREWTRSPEEADPLQVGCGCDGTGSPAGAAWVLLLLGLRRRDGASSG